MRYTTLQIEMQTRDKLYMTVATTASFLEQIQIKTGLDDIYDARDLSEVVFRTMRDLMTKEASDRIASDLASSTYLSDAERPEIIALWKDTNPLVRFLSRMRSPFVIEDDTFIFRVEQEGTMPKNMDGITVVGVVFSTLKKALSAASIREIGQTLPGQIRVMWQNA